jgi:hypothetical protein
MSTTLAVIPPNEQREIETTLRELLAFLQDVQITETPGVRGLSAIVADVTALDAVDCIHKLERGESLVVELRKYEDAVKAKLDTPTDYANRIHKFFTGLRARFAGQAETEAKKLARVCGAYRQRLADEARRREETERKEGQREADVENARRRKEYEEQVEAERKRIAEERVTEAVEVAARLEAEGRKDDAELVLANAADFGRFAAEDVNLPEPELAVPEPVAVAQPMANLQGVGYRRVWKFRIVDTARIQREYLQPNEQKIRKIVEAMGRDAPVKGIEVYEDQVASVKRR